jgi:hypothetical protein
MASPANCPRRGVFLNRSLSSFPTGDGSQLTQDIRVTVLPLTKPMKRPGNLTNRLPFGTLGQHPKPVVGIRERYEVDRSKLLANFIISSERMQVS